MQSYILRDMIGKAVVGQKKAMGKNHGSAFPVHNDLLQLMAEDQQRDPHG